MAVADTPMNVDLRPIRVWLRRLIRRAEQAGSHAPSKQVAMNLGISPRTLSYYLNDPTKTTMRWTLLDRLVCKEGHYAIAEVIALEYTEEEAAPADLLPHVCVSCGEPAEAGRRFCPEHTAALAMIASSLRHEGKSMASAAMAPFRAIKKGPRPIVPTCTRRGCWNPRVPPDSYCDDCARTDWDLEDDLA